MKSGGLIITNCTVILRGLRAEFPAALRKNKSPKTDRDQVHCKSSTMHSLVIALVTNCARY